MHVTEKRDKVTIQQKVHLMAKIQMKVHNASEPKNIFLKNSKQESKGYCSEVHQAVV